MKFKSIISTITLLCLLFLASCVYNKKTSLEAFKQDVYTPEYATGFKILGADNAASTLIQVSNPWQGAKDVKMSYFISRKVNKRLPDLPVLRFLPEQNVSYVWLLPTSPCSTL
mgnify:CR=1 FL=1